MEPTTPETPQELIALNSETDPGEFSFKIAEAQQTISDLHMGPIEELDLLLGIVRRQTDWHHFMMARLMEESEPDSHSRVAIWSTDLQRLEQSLDLLTKVRFGG